MAFLKQSKGLKDWANKFRIKAQDVLRQGAVIQKNYKGKGALGRSIKVFIVESKTSLSLNIKYNWYGNLVEAGGPFGPRRKFITPRPWFATTYQSLEDDLAKVIEDGLVEGLEKAIKP